MNTDMMIDSYDRSVNSVNSLTNNCLREEFSFKTTSSSMAVDKAEVVRKIICRYGRGCTHMHDACHRAKFWHPPMPALTAEQLRTHYVCNECGLATSSLDKLQLHLQKKTAWSNKSLIGCRISCLVDFKEWHEGHVTQYHRSGKHYVEFRAIGEKRWLNMKKIVFYIVERPLYSSNSFGDFKDDEIFENSGLAPVEDKWIYCDDISLDYAFAQSVLFKVYGSTVQETGHKTKGHVCLTDDDKDNVKNNKGSLLYGELLPRGANKAFDDQHLAASDAAVLFDLGMGAGKVAIQAFVQFRNLRYVYGVELSLGRYCLAEDAVLRMVRLLGAELFTVKIVQGQSITVTERVADDMGEESDDDLEEGGLQIGLGPCNLTPLGIEYSESNTSGGYEATETKSEEINDTTTRFRSEECKYNPRTDSEMRVPGSKTQKRKKGRTLKLEFGNMFDVKNIHTADIVMLETDIPTDLQRDLCVLLSGMKLDSRTLTYLDLRKTWSPNVFFPYRQLENNKNLSDRFPTSWSVQRGHHFYVWNKIHAANLNNMNNCNVFTGPHLKCLSPVRSENPLMDPPSNGSSSPHRAPSAYSMDQEVRCNLYDANGNIASRSSGTKAVRAEPWRQTVLERCIPFSFPYSFRSMFVGGEVRTSKTRCPHRHSVGGLGGAGTSPSCVAKVITCDNGFESQSPPSVKRASEDSDKVIPVNSDGTRVFSTPNQQTAGSTSGGGSGSGNGNADDWSSHDGSKAGSAGKSLPSRDPSPTPLACGGFKLPRRSSLTAVTPGESSSAERNILSDTIDVVSYAEEGEGRNEKLKHNRERKLVPDRIGREIVPDRSTDGEESWYTLGYAIERMSFPLRVGGDPDISRNVPHMCEENDVNSDCDMAERAEEQPRSDEGQGQGGLFLDKSMSYALHHGGSTWSNSIVRASKLDGDKNEIYEADAARSSSSDSPFPAADRTRSSVTSSNCRTFQTVTSMSFNAPESRRTSFGPGSVGGERGPWTAPVPADQNKSPPRTTVNGKQLQTFSESNERFHSPVSPNSKQKNRDWGRKNPSPEGSGCAIN